MLREMTTTSMKVLKKNAPSILTAVGATGVATTAYLTAKATFEAAEIIRIEEMEAGTADTLKQRLRERSRHVWKLYIPPVISGITTIGCIIAASKVESRRTAAFAAAYSLSERAFVEYREKVVETIGDKKEKTIRDSIAQDIVATQPPSIIYGGGGVLCCELYTGRYFMSDMETIRKAQNDINSRILRNDEATISDLYYILGLPTTTISGHIGWTSDKQLELEFTTVLSEDNRPCLAFEYNYTKPL